MTKVRGEAGELKKSVIDVEHKQSCSVTNRLLHPFTQKSTGEKYGDRGK